MALHSSPLTPGRSPGPASLLETRLESLLESSLEDASGRLSAYARRFLRIHIESVRVMDVERPVESHGFGWQFADVVRIRFEGPCRGDLVLALTPDVAGQLAGVMLGESQAPGDEDCTEVRVLAEMECAQILAYTFLREVSRDTGATFFPRPSEFLRDRAARIIERTAGELDTVWQVTLRLETDHVGFTCPLSLVLSPELARLLGS